MISQSRQLPDTAKTESTGNLKISELVELAWRRKWYLLGCVVVSLSVGVVYLLRADTVYHVSARLLVEQHGSFLERNEIRKDEQFLATQAEIVRSPTVVQRAVDGLKRADDDESSRSASSILAALKVAPVVGTSVLSVSMRSPDREQGVDVVAAVIDSYQQYLRDSEHDTQLDTLKVLTATDKELRAELDEKQRRHLELRESSPLMDLGRDVHRSFMTQLGQLLAEVRGQRVAIEAQLGATINSHPPKMSVGAANPAGEAPPANDFSADNPVSFLSENRETGLVAGADTGVVSTSSVAATQAVVYSPPTKELVAIDDLSAIEEELFRVRVQRDELSPKFGPLHPEIKALDGQIAAWQKKLEELTITAPQRLEQRLAALLKYENALSAFCKEELKKARTIDTQLLKEQQSAEAIQLAKETFNTTQRQLSSWEMTHQALASGQSRVRVTVLESPDMTGRAIRPPSTALLAVFCLLGLVGGFGAITLLERVDPRIRSVNGLQTKLDLPILGRVPHIPHRGSAKLLYRSRFVHQAPESPVAASFRSLCTRLESGDRHTGCVIQLASPSKGEGTSTITANLAFSFAQLGRSVIVVDTDLQHGFLHDVFDVPNRNGLSDMLRNGATVNDTIQRSSLAPVDVLPRGSGVGNPVEFLRRPDLSHVLASLRSQYSVVLLDAPALLASTEAFLLGSDPDRLVLNVAAGKTLVADAARAKELLESLNAHPTGIVVNRSL